MNLIASHLELSNVGRREVQQFIRKWRVSGDLPCSSIQIEEGVDGVTLQLSYPTGVFDRSVAQFLAVLFGELSFLKAFGRARFVGLDLSEEVYNWFGGPRFGAHAVQSRFKVRKSPMLVAILKPALGASLEQTASSVRAVREAGFHAVKDDEMQGDLPGNRLAQRLLLAESEPCYIPALNVDSVEEMDRALKRSNNVPMILVNASTVGFSMLNRMRQSLNVPILSHVALQGVFHASFSPTVFAQLHRLFGCDAMITPIGDAGYFSISRNEEAAMVEELTRKAPIRPTLPVLTGGARLSNLRKIVSPYLRSKISFGVAFGAQVFCTDTAPGEQCKAIINEIQRARSVATHRLGL